MLILFSFIVNLVSMLIVYIVGKYTIHDECMKIAMSVAMFSPNAISMPIMVMQSLCEQVIINHDYDDDSKLCYSEASSMLFVYSIGWHILFWSYGFNQLKRIPTIIAKYNNDNKNYTGKYLLQQLLTHSLTHSITTQIL